ncbi:Leucine-rich repeat receptor-like protein kinase PXL1 [Morella rubra]|uniref:Leucine-rich repeat receptor-like protein kinase PXL1 n=1 Tax=Morella rubra TaxID=262757 RepID=A0A6A1VRK3_9ROSI|nr:Leucine-rich repeat receptor-like protein kinase PXL1 [Morella rubra]
MAALEYLDLTRNNWSGKIPSSLFFLKNLSIVYFYKNKLSGKIPRVVEAMNIKVIDLSNNHLTGTVPEDFGKYGNLSELNLSFNQLSGEIPDSIGLLPGLKILKLFNNNFSGTLPPDFGRNSMLEEIQVACNRFTGKLPEHLCDNGRLVGLVAFENDLHGELPRSLGNCSGLEIVAVEKNMFSGNIPCGLWTLLNLSILTFSDNLCTGELLEELSQNLSRLEISNSRFSEYALTTRVNEKIDVYSFGVILLELATGRKANDGDEHASLAEWAWRHYQDGNPIVNALDEEVEEPCYLDQMCCVFTLGIICTGTQPSTRPSMKEVLRILVQCNQPLGYAKKNAANDCNISPLLENSKRETGKLENTSV